MHDGYRRRGVWADAAVDDVEGGKGVPSLCWERRDDSGIASSEVVDCVVGAKEGKLTTRSCVWSNSIVQIFLMSKKTFPQ